MTTQKAITGAGQSITINAQTINSQNGLVKLEGNFATINIFGLKRRQVVIQPEANKTVFCQQIKLFDCSGVMIKGQGRMMVSSKVSEMDEHHEFPMVSIDGSNCTVEGLTVNSTANTEDWSGSTWDNEARNGIVMSGKNCSASRNLIYNVRKGIEMRARNGHVNGNIIEDFCEDGIRAIADGVKVSGNKISMARSTPMNSDEHTGVHCDAIQLWKHGAQSPATGVLKGVVVTNNQIWNNSAYPGLTPLQGIGCFDGLLRKAVISGNEVFTDHKHGISLGKAQQCIMDNNIVVSTQPEKVVSWINISTNKNLPFESSRNQVRGNQSGEFNLEGVTKNSGNVVLDEDQMIALRDFDLEREVA